MISLIATVLNEEDNLADWLSGILSQSWQPDEIVIVDGGSIDKTWDILLDKSKTVVNLKIFQHQGNISAGRNFAIREAKGDIIVTTDAGCNYEKDWLKFLVSPIIENKSSFVTTAFGPWFKNGDGFLTYFIASATVPVPKEFQKKWLPSSRSVAFKKSLWENVGGYPEWIPYCEDVIFDLKIIKIIQEPFLVREPLVWWRPRRSLSSYLRQLFNYTRSDAHGKLFLRRQLIRYGVYIGLVLLLILSEYSLWWLMPVILAGCVYMYKFWARFWEFTKEKDKIVRLLGMVAVPFVIVLGDLAKMAGWIFGLFDRWSGKIKYKN